MNSPEVYRNDTWDLVDAIRTGKCKLYDLKDEEPPEDLRRLGRAERRAGSIAILTSARLSGTTSSF
jgi:hypothetical protein